MKAPLAALIPALAAAAPADAQAQAGTEAFRGRYAVDRGGFGVGDLILTVHLGADRYAIAMAFEVDGIADWFVEVRSRLYAEGRVAAGGLEAERYRYDTHFHGGDYAREVRFGANGAVRSVTVDWPADSNF